MSHVVDKKLPIVAIVDDGPTSRLYLEMLRKNGFTVEKIIYVVQENRLKFPAFINYFPKSLSVKLKCFISKIKSCYYPKYISLNHHKLFSKIIEALENFHEDISEVFSISFNHFSYKEYSENVSFHVVKNFKDKKFHDLIRNETTKTFLFTGGGIVPRSILEIDNKRFIHVHPGRLPHVKGADCFLWALMMKENPSFSCFFLAPGIDTGDLLLVKTFEFSSIQLPESEEHYSTDLLYKALFSYIDPFFRALTLVEFIKENYFKIEDIDGSKQPLGKGATFNFMHPNIKPLALKKMFVSSEKPNV